jgi:hypothetical protein
MTGDITGVTRASVIDVFGRPIRLRRNLTPHRNLNSGNRRVFWPVLFESSRAAGFRLTAVESCENHIRNLAFRPFASL